MDLKEFHRRSIEDREAFWAEQATLIDWHAPFTKVLDDSRLPFTRWFVDGQTNLCHNAIDRHLAAQSDKPALIRCRIAQANSLAPTATKRAFQ